MFNTPILLINFNRPGFTAEVLRVVMQQSPAHLYVFQDGARQVVQQMTQGTPTQVHTFYSDHNLGCGPGPAAALSWYFSQVEQGIVLEDDAVPHPDFFGYAEQLLNRYRDDADVMAIGSMNVDKQRWGDGSYYFSMMNRNLCAWASWRRAWQHFDIRLFNTSRRDLSQALRRYGCDVLEREYWCDRLDEVHRDGVGGTSWDMQFFMSIWLQPTPRARAISSTTCRPTPSCLWCTHPPPRWCARPTGSSTTCISSAPSAIGLKARYATI